MTPTCAGALYVSGTVVAGTNVSGTVVAGANLSAAPSSGPSSPAPAERVQAQSSLKVISI
tara:strand:+ start:346 stop:525 length:180 start_codon:yes stop_codon:yes gene_type:complete